MNTPANHLLLVEDDANLAELIADVAREVGFEVTVAATAEGCRRAYLEVTPTVVILDVILPFEGAAELLPFLAEERCTAPIVLISGFDRDVLLTVERMAQSQGLRVAGAYMKPFHMDHIASMLRDMLRHEGH